MTLSAWFMMIATWAVIGGLTIRFLWQVLADAGGTSEPQKDKTP